MECLALFLIFYMVSSMIIAHWVVGHRIIKYADKNWLTLKDGIGFALLYIYMIFLWPYEAWKFVKRKH